LKTSGGSDEDLDGEAIDLAGFKPADRHDGNGRLDE
jgi:hypothetical protein